jgi:dienelactone hydrolase
MRYQWMAAVAIVMASTQAAGAVITKEVAYKEGDAELVGILAYDDARVSKGKAPGILVVHDWMGVGPYVKRRAEQLAGLGYVAFAADIYGQKLRPTDQKSAGAAAGSFKKDRPLLRRRVNAGLKVLRESQGVDTAKIAAMGYCFGGTAVLELARSGADVLGFVSFHGGLDSPTPVDAKNIKGRVLALHGADDPNVPPAQVSAFEDEMRQASVDWQLVAYGGAVHSFTNPEAGNDNSKGAAYNEKADKRSWVAMQDFFNELF